MPITPAFTSALRALEASITQAQQQRQALLRIEPSLEEKLDNDWAAFVPAMRTFLDNAVKAQAPIDQSGISRDGGEISLKFKDATAPRGTRYLILSRRNPLDVDAPLDKVWVCEVGGDPLGFPDVLEAVRALIKRLIAARS